MKPLRLKAKTLRPILKTLDTSTKTVAGTRRNDPRYESPEARGYGWDWRTKIRPQVLRRDQYICQVCWIDGRITPATQVDHIINKKAGGDNSLANLQAICRVCHDRKSAAEGNATRQGGDIKR